MFFYLVSIQYIYNKYSKNSFPDSKNPKLILSTKRRKLLLKQNENLTLGCRFHNDQNTKTKATSRFADNNYKNRHLKSNLRNGYSRMFHEKRRSINFLEKESSVNLYRNIRRKHLVMQWFKNGKPLIPTRTNKFVFKVFFNHPLVSVIFQKFIPSFCHSSQVYLCSRACL